MSPRTEERRDGCRDPSTRHRAPCPRAASASGDARDVSAKRSKPQSTGPASRPLNAQREWPKFSEWVGELRDRYKGLDSYVVPACWYEHESLVMALQALRDHERVAYAKSSPASSGTDWHRAYRDITALLRAFTADLRCGHGPESAEHRSFRQVRGGGRCAATSPGDRRGVGSIRAVSPLPG